MSSEAKSYDKFENKRPLFKSRQKGEKGYGA
jgi:hypothetical protein